MKLLIITQAVDLNDPVLGFMHRWIEELAKKSERLTVVCLRVGDQKLPPNTEVIALEKRGRFLRALEVCSIAFARRGEYDRVFVHMNQEYILAAGWLWFFLGKQIYLWRNHYAGNFLTDIAVVFCRKVFCTSRFSYTAKYAKTVLMPIGLSTETFFPVSGIARVSNSILFLARIAPSKRAHIFVEALVLLRKKGIEFSASIYGSPAKGDESYAEELVRKVAATGLSDRVSFHKGVPNSETPKAYSAHDIFVNLSPSGMYDKTIFEAAACGSLVIASSLDFAGHVDERLVFKQDDAEDLAQKLSTLLSIPETERKPLKHSLAILVKRNTLETLTQRLLGEMQ